MPLIKTRMASQPTVETESPLAARNGDDWQADLADPSPSVRWTAVIRIAENPTPAMATALCARLEAEASASVREAILVALAEIGGEATVAGLLPLLRSEDPVLRNGAIETLQQLPDMVAPRMAALLSDPDSDVRIFAVNVAGSLRHRDVEHWLLTVLRDDPHVNVVAAALDTLSEIGTEASIAALERLPSRFPDDAFLAFTARTVLRRIRGG